MRPEATTWSMRSNWASNVRDQAKKSFLQPNGNGLPPNSNGLQPISDGSNLDLLMCAGSFCCLPTSFHLHLEILKFCAARPADLHQWGTSIVTCVQLDEIVTVTWTHDLGTRGTLAAKRWPQQLVLSIVICHWGCCHFLSNIGWLMCHDTKP